MNSKFYKGVYNYLINEEWNKFRKDVCSSDENMLYRWERDKGEYKGKLDLLARNITIFNDFLEDSGLRKVCRRCHKCCWDCNIYKDEYICRNTVCLEYICLKLKEVILSKEEELVISQAKNYLFIPYNCSKENSKLATKMLKDITFEISERINTLFSILRLD